MKQQLEQKNIPKGWEEKEMGRIILENKKSKIQVNQAGDFGKYLFYTSGESLLKYGSFLVDGENIFMATGGVANVKYHKGKCAYSTDTYSFKSKVNTFYLYNYLSLILDKINSLYFEGTGLKHLQKDRFKKIRFNIPKLEKEQEKIDSILQEVDNSIEGTQKIINKYKKIKAGLIQNFFLYLFKEGSEGYILEPFLKKIKIIDYRGRTPPFSEEGIPYIGSENIKKGYIRLRGCRFVTDKTYKKYMTRGFPSKRDILFTTEAPLAEVARVPDFKFCFAQRAIVFQCEPALDRDFFLYMLMTNAMINQFYSLATGSTVKGISEKKMKYLKIHYPVDKDLQINIGKIITSADNKIEDEEKYLDKLIKIKKGLMQDLLTGKVRVKVEK